MTPRRRHNRALYIFAFITFVCSLSLSFNVHAQSSSSDFCFKELTGFLALAWPVELLVAAVTIPGNSIALATRKNRFSMGLAGLILSSGGFALSLFLMDWNPCEAFHLGSEVYITLPYLSLISYSIFTMLMEKLPGFARSFGIWSGVGLFSATWLTVLITSLVGMSFSESLTWSIPSMILSVSLFTVGIFSSSESGKKRLSVAPWFAPVPGSNGFRTGIVFGGSF